MNSIINSSDTPTSCSSLGIAPPFDPGADPLRASLCLVLFVLGSLHVVIAVSLFFVAYELLPGEYIRKRSRALVMLSALATTMQLFSGLMNSEMIEIPSWLYLAFTVLIVPIGSIPIPIKLFDFYANVIFARAIAEVEIEAVDFFVEEDQESRKSAMVNTGRVSELSTSHVVSPPSESFRTGTPPPRQSVDGSDLSLSRSARKTTNMRASISLSEHSRGQQEFLEDARMKKVISFKELLFLKFLASARLKSILLFVYLAPFVGVIIANYIIFPELFQCKGAAIPLFNTIVVMVSGAISVVLGIIAALSVRNFYDPLMISRECRWYLQYGGMIALISYAFDANDPMPPPGLSFDFLVAIGFHIMLFTVTELQVLIALRMEDSSLPEVFSQYHQKKNDKGNRRRSQRLNSGSGSILIDFLSNPDDVELFEKYLIGEFSVEMLRMYIECRSWERTFYDHSDATKRARAKRIASLFVEPGSLFEANISATIREEIVAAVKSSAPLSRNLFKTSQEEMLGMMYDPYIRFTKTPEYLNGKRDRRRTE